MYNVEKKVFLMEALKLNFLLCVSCFSGSSILYMLRKIKLLRLFCPLEKILNIGTRYNSGPDKMILIHFFMLFSISTAINSRNNVIRKKK